MSSKKKCYKRKSTRCHHISHNIKHFRWVLWKYFIYFSRFNHVLQHYMVTSDLMTGEWGKRQANQQKQTTVVGVQKARSVRSALFPRARTNPECLSLASLCHIYSPESDCYEQTNWKILIFTAVLISPPKFRAQHYANHSLRPLICFCLSSALPMQNLKPHAHLCSKEDGLETAVF